MSVFSSGRIRLLYFSSLCSVACCPLCLLSYIASVCLKTIGFVTKDMMEKPCFCVCALIKTSPPMSFCFTSCISTFWRSLVANSSSCSVNELLYQFVGDVSQLNEFVTVVFFVFWGRWQFMKRVRLDKIVFLVQRWAADETNLLLCLLFIFASSNYVFS